MTVNAFFSEKGSRRWCYSLAAKSHSAASTGYYYNSLVSFCHIWMKYIHKIQKDKAREPTEAIKAYEKDYL